MWSKIKMALIWAGIALLSVATLGAFYYRRRAKKAERERDESIAREKRTTEIADGAIAHIADVSTVTEEANVEVAKVKARVEEEAKSIDAMSDDDLALEINEWKNERDKRQVAEQSD